MDSCQAPLKAITAYFSHPPTLPLGTSLPILSNYLKSQPAQQTLIKRL